MDERRSAGIWQLVDRWGGPRELWLSGVLAVVLCFVTLLQIWSCRLHLAIGLKALDDLGLVAPRCMLDLRAVTAWADSHCWWIVTVPLLAWATARMFLPRSWRWVGLALWAAAIVTVNCHTWRVLRACESGTREVFIVAKIVLDKHLDRNVADQIREGMNSETRRADP